MAQTALHGIDQSGPSAARPTNAPDGFTFFDNTLGRLLVYDARARSFFDAQGAALWSASAPTAVADHFNAAAIDSRWSLNKGSNGSTVNAAIASGNAGYARMTTGAAAGTTVAVDGVSMGGPLEFEAEEAIEYTARVKVDNATLCMFFAGFTDVLPATTLELPFTLSVVTYTSNATNAVGFLWDPAATTDTLRLVGVKADTDATPVDTGKVIANATWINLWIRVKVDGTAQFFVNGAYVGQVADSVTVTTALCPVVAGISRSAAARTIDVDYCTARAAA